MEALKLVQIKKKKILKNCTVSTEWQLYIEHLTFVQIKIYGITKEEIVKAILIQLDQRKMKVAS